MKTSPHALLVLLMLLIATPVQAKWVSRTDDGIMGTRIFVELWADDTPEGITKGQQAIDAVMAEMHHIDDTMSTYKSTSEVSKVNRLAAKGPVVISPQLFYVLQQSLKYSRITEGAFDVTYASVGYLYNFHSRPQYRFGSLLPPDTRPTPAQIKAALPAISYRHIVLDAKRHTVRFTRPGVRIDLGGIAKGYSVDQGIDILLAHGYKNALVNAGGDSRVIGDHRGRPWLVGIQNPRHPDEIVTRFPLVNEAFSTSGDYERYFIQHGVRYNHIIDPHTGDSARKVLSATVIAPTATNTDGLSKTAFVLGPAEALKIYNNLPNVQAILVTPDGRVVYTKGLTPGHLPPPGPAPRASATP